MADTKEVPELQMRVVTVWEVYDTLTPMQKKMVEILCEHAFKEGKKSRSKH